MNYQRTLCFPLPILLAVVALAMVGCASLKPVEVIDVTGPDSLLTSEHGEFTATVGPEDATQPVFGTWSFGDGETADGFEASHTYAEPGTYTVTFTASNQKGDRTSSDTGDLRVVVERPVSAPTIVSMSFEPRSPDTHSDIRFMPVVRADDREVTGYSWSFGDGESSTDEQPTHSYGDVGSFDVQLTATNSAGSDTRTVTVDVDPYEAEVCRDLEDLNAAFFDRNSSELSDDARGALQDNLEILNVCPNTCVTIAGYTDPDERRAEELSAGRANVVQQFYLDGDVPASRLAAEGRGSVEGVSRKEGLAQLRRAESLPNRCVEM